MEPDSDLVARARNGDREAFAALIERHHQRVYNVALRLLGKTEDAHDATQDAFLSALRNLGSFRGDAAFMTWMHRVTVNACYDLLRRSVRAPIAELPEDSQPGAPADDPADIAAGTVDIQRALAAVPPEFRAALVLHDVQDLAYEEVAAILEIPVGTVKSRVHRGRVALARALGSGRERGARAGPSEGKMTT